MEMADNFSRDEYEKMIFDLISELSTQLDMFYDPEDYYKLKRTFEIMQPSLRMMHLRGITLPEEVQFVCARYARTLV